MIYSSTRNRNLIASAPEAILNGIAKDGGLYTPLAFEQMQIDVKALMEMSAVEISAEVIGQILQDFPKSEMRALIERAYENKFTVEELTPVVKVGDSFILELFHGPTSAFKDVALSVLPHLIVSSREKQGVQDEIVILTATSGDTGKAALEGFHDVPGTKIVVFYPDGGVSDVQRRQMVTQTGENVHVCAIKGNFDDAQTGVKQIFAEEKWTEMEGVRLSSANSINLGRLAPQVAYYFKSYTDLVKRGEIVMGDEINFVVPTGNFGDILAGEFARRMGLPIAHLICASNANNVLTDFIRTGTYDRRRKFHKTISPSMDILVSSNLERYLYILSDGDDELVASCMEQLKKDGIYTISQELTRKMQKRFFAYDASDEEAMSAICRVWKEQKYLLDPHTAVAWVALDKYRAETQDTTKTVVLATASPYKFSEHVLKAINPGETSTGFEAMEQLHTLTGVVVPKNLSGLKEMPIRFEDTIEKDAMSTYVEKAVRE